MRIMNVHMNICMNAGMHARTHTRTHTPTHALTRTHTHANEHTRTHSPGSAMGQVFAYVSRTSETKMRTWYELYFIIGLLVWERKNRMVVQIMGNFIMKLNKL